MNRTAHSEKFHIAADHPALPGHFPDNPVVPGVVLLDRVASAVERAWGQRAGGFPQVKFQRPLLPAQAVELFIECDATGARFRFVSGADVIASGAIELGKTG
jgi:3-hydroxyacyl-[acyl-carrier-protein] dehydratase